MSAAALNSLRGVFTDGDLDGARSHLLHSSAWTQHDLTAYGDELITRCWMAWLAQCGFSRCEEEQSVDADEQSLRVITLHPDRGSGPVRIAFWAWSNERYLKRVSCIIDTAMMAASLGVRPLELAAQLPPSDPLVIDDYDQQRHPHSVDVAPCDLAECDAGVRRALQGWWSLWQHQQLASLRECYAPDASILLPGACEPVDAGALVGYCGGWFQRQVRRFCQPESVIVDRNDAGTVGVLWRMEGDMQLARNERRVRVRVPVINLLRIRAGRIQAETMLIDEAILARQLAG